MLIAIIEEDFLIAKLMSNILTSHGHQIVGVAGSLMRGFSIVEYNQIDVAIVDLHLAGSSAEPLVRRLLERGISTLLVSGYSDQDRPDWAISCLKKPFAPEELLAAIANFRT